MIANKIQRGVILFPRNGAEELITQLIGFEVEKHDDLVDALTTAVLEFVCDDCRGGTVSFGNASDIFGNRYPGSNSRWSGRDYWNRRLDDWNEATSGDWD